MSGGGESTQAVDWPTRTRVLFERMKLIWVIPLVALVAGGYLITGKVAERGPEITLTFSTADGVGVGTKIEHKAVELGAVTAVGLADDLGRVELRVRMQSAAAPYLTDTAQFWVSQFKISGSGVTGLSSLTSGKFIEMDPGARTGLRRTSFTGLSSPPGLRSDRPGTMFQLYAPTVTALSSGTGIFYRDVLVGEVLDMHVAEGVEPVHATIFVQKPYDAQVRTGTVFWQAKGIETNVTNTGLHVQISSLEAASSGGVAFGLPPRHSDYPPAQANTPFKLFTDEDTANRASFNQRIPYVLYFKASTSGLDTGSAVMLQGTQVGEVTGLQLTDAPGTVEGRVRVMIDLLPQAIDVVGGPSESTAALGRRLIEAGLQAKLETTSYVKNSQSVTLAFQPAHGAVVSEDGVLVMPTSEEAATGGVVSRVQNALQSALNLPVEAMANTANATVSGLSQKIAGLQTGSGLGPVKVMLESTQAQIRQLNASLSQTLAGLPTMADKLEHTLASANRSVSSLDAEYGTGSELTDEIGRMLAKYYDTARHARMLADYLNRHPEAVIRGSTGQASER